MPQLSEKNGFSIVEIVIGAAIVAMVTTAIAAAWQFYTVMSLQSARQAQAAVLLEEGGEIVRYLRDKGWDANIAVWSLDKEYYLIWWNGDFVATTTPTAINTDYSRTVEFSSVTRNAQDDIVKSGGTTDPSTRLVDIRVRSGTSTTTAPLLYGQMLIHDTYEN